jgi:hypothetical protein
MSSTLLRLGLWILILSLALYVIDTSFSHSPLAGFVGLDLLSKLFILSGALVAAGIVVRLFDKTAVKVLSKNHCRVCNTVIPQGAIYCRPHLRGMLEREDRKTHSGSRVR